MATVCKKCNKEISYPAAHARGCEDKIKKEVLPVEEVDVAPIEEKATPERLTPPEKEEVDVGGDPVKKQEVDYLRKFQYRKDTILGSIQSDPIVGSKAERQKKHYLGQEKVRIMIPRKMDESPKVLYTVNENGYRLDLPKNEYIDVPRQVADVIMNSFNQTEIALSYNKIDGNKDKENLLN